MGSLISWPHIFLGRNIHTHTIYSSLLEINRVQYTKYTSRYLLYFDWHGTFSECTDKTGLVCKTYAGMGGCLYVVLESRPLHSAAESSSSPKHMTRKSDNDLVFFSPKRWVQTSCR